MRPAAGPPPEPALPLPFARMTPVPPTPACLEVRALSCIRADRLIFEALDFTARAGEVWQVTGANGAGKTSLLRLLAGLGTPAAGTLHWCGEPLPEARDYYQAELLFLGHAPAVAGFLNAHENLMHACALSNQPLRMPLGAALTRVGLPPADDAPAQRLSAGQRQRLALARFALVPARLWIMDEPLTALDVAGRELVEALLTEHAARGGVAIVSTHQGLQLPAGVLHQFDLSGLQA